MAMALDFLSQHSVITQTLAEHQALCLVPQRSPCPPRTPELMQGEK